MEEGIINQRLSETTTVTKSAGANHLDSYWLEGKEVVIHDLEQGDARSQVPRDVFYGGCRHTLEEDTTGRITKEMQAGFAHRCR